MSFPNFQSFLSICADHSTVGSGSLSIDRVGLTSIRGRSAKIGDRVQVDSLVERRLDIGVESGDAVVDWKNSSARPIVTVIEPRG